MLGELHFLVVVAGVNLGRTGTLGHNHGADGAFEVFLVGLGNPLSDVVAADGFLHFGLFVLVAEHEVGVGQDLLNKVKFKHDQELSGQVKSEDFVVLASELGRVHEGLFVRSNEETRSVDYFSILQHTLKTTLITLTNLPCAIQGVPGGTCSKRPG